MEESILSTKEYDLIKKIADKDGTAFSDFYNMYSKFVYNRSLRIVCDRGEAEEVVQEVFLQIWNTAETYNSSRGELLSWVLNITKSRAIDKLRNTKFKKQTISIKEECPLLKCDFRIKTEEEVEKTLIIKSALENLPTDQKKAIEIVYYDGLTQFEAAEKLKIPVGTIKTRIRLAVLKLRVNLSPYFNDETVANF